MAKLKKYYVHYTFEGLGTATIEAESQEEAEELFYEGGNLIDDDDDSQNYEIDRIEEIK